MTRNSAWWVDGTVPDLSKTFQGLGISAEEFAAGLSPHLAEYRDWMQKRKIDANPTQNLASIARDASKLASLLSDVSQNATLIMDSAPGLKRHFVRQIERDLRVLAVLATHARNTLKGNSGRKPESARNALLSAVVTELSKSISKLSTARELAEQILVLCGVPVPSNRSGGIIKATRKRKK